MRNDITETASISPGCGSFARRHGTTMGLSILLVCAVAYSVDGKQNNVTLHAANQRSVRI